MESFLKKCSNLRKNATLLGVVKYNKTIILPDTFDLVSTTEHFVIIILEHIEVSKAGEIDKLLSLFLKYNV